MLITVTWIYGWADFESEVVYHNPWDWILLIFRHTEAEGIGFRILHLFFKVVRFSDLDTSLNNKHSAQFIRSVVVVSDSLQPHGLQHARLPCPSPTPRACSNSCSSSQWCHPTISSSVSPFSCCLRSFPSIRVFSSDSHQVDKVLELQHQSFQWTFRTDIL